MLLFNVIYHTSIILILVFVLYYNNTTHFAPMELIYICIVRACALDSCIKYYHKAIQSWSCILGCGKDHGSRDYHDHSLSPWRSWGKQHHRWVCMLQKRGIYPHAALNLFIFLGAASCRYVRRFSFEGGNMTCPDSAPVLVSLQTIAPYVSRVCAFVQHIVRLHGIARN